MPEIKCPSCGAVINVPEKKTGLWWGIGCLIAALALPVIVAIIGLLAAIAIPSFMKIRSESQRATCFNNMRMLETAKEAIALERSIEGGQGVQENLIDAFLGNPVICPAGGEYTLNPVGEGPECSVHGPLQDAGKPPRSQHSPGH